MHHGRFFMGSVFTFVIILAAILFNILVYPSILSGATGWDQTAVVSKKNTPSTVVEYLSENEAIYRAKAEIERPSFSTAKLETKTRFLNSETSSDQAIWQVLFFPKEDDKSDLAFCSVIMDASTGDIIHTNTERGSRSEPHYWSDMVTLFYYNYRGDIYYNIIYIDNDAQIYRYETGISSKELMSKFTYPATSFSAVSSGSSA